MTQQEDKSRDKHEQETKKIKFNKSQTATVTEPEKNITEETNPANKEKKESFEEWSHNFNPTKNGKGMLLSANCDIKFVMKIPDNTSVTIPKGENLLVLHMFEHVSTGEKAIIFLTGEQKCMYLSEKFETDFSVISNGVETDVYSD